VLGAVETIPSLHCVDGIASAVAWRLLLFAVCVVLVTPLGADITGYEAFSGKLSPVRSQSGKEPRR
jgi:hypothetical protein